MKNIELNGDIVEIDDSIVELITLLNQKKYYTQECCSGMHKDHTYMAEHSAMRITFSQYLNPKQLILLEKACLRSDLIFSKEYELGIIWSRKEPDHLKENKIKKLIEYLNNHERDR
ncbi:hypothetical protein LCGC14_1161030 [marine sediment metagenome]|uniref:Uncharacterized protein n=1 Tax=marine sediment metagenome TaxID=412755 RepID=A0A0F9LSI1_9ZZZZ